jgi:hypothetical protein
VVFGPWSLANRRAIGWSEAQRKWVVSWLLSARLVT